MKNKTLQDGGCQKNLTGSVRGGLVRISFQGKEIVSNVPMRLGVKCRNVNWMVSCGQVGVTFSMCKVLLPRISGLRVSGDPLPIWSLTIPIQRLHRSEERRVGKEGRC